MDNRDRTVPRYLSWRRRRVLTAWETDLAWVKRETHVLVGCVPVQISGNGSGRDLGNS